MKNILKITCVTFLCCVSLILISSCEENKHEHSYSPKYSYNDTYHWNQATCSHNEKNNYEQHQLSVWKTIIEATTSENGKKERHCTICGWIEEEVIPMLHKHEYTDIKVIQATCTTEGYTIYTCECGESYNDDYVPIGEHDLVKYEELESTCLINGYLAYEKCNICSYTTYQELPLANHIYTEWQILKEAACEISGSKKRNCIWCDKEETKEITKLNHSYDNLGICTRCKGLDVGYLNNYRVTILKEINEKWMIIQENNSLTSEFEERYNSLISEINSSTSIYMMEYYKNQFQNLCNEIEQDDVSNNIYEMYDKLEGLMWNIILYDDVNAGMYLPVGGDGGVIRLTYTLEPINTHKKLFTLDQPGYDGNIKLLLEINGSSKRLELYTPDDPIIDTYTYDDGQDVMTIVVFGSMQNGSYPAGKYVAHVTNEKDIYSSTYVYYDRDNKILNILATQDEFVFDENGICSRQ